MKRNILTDDEVLAIKSNVERRNINQWATELGVTYRTIQKVVFKETYRDVGELAECWLELREKQRPGRKAAGTTSSPVQPSPLEPHLLLIVEAHNQFLARLADMLKKKHGVDTTPERVKAFLANHGRMGLRLGRTAKLNTREVIAIRRDMANGMGYDAISAKYGISRPLISKVCGRGKHDAHSYVPSDADTLDDMSEMGHEVPDYDIPDDDTPEVTEGVTTDA